MSNIEFATCPTCNCHAFPMEYQHAPDLHTFTTRYPCLYETVTIIENNHVIVQHKCRLSEGIQHKEKLKNKTVNGMWEWEPLDYICEGFNDNFETVSGVLPQDVRAKCSFPIKRIHGPVVKGLGSWLMHQIVSIAP